MPKVITERSFYKYLKCPSWIAHEAKEEQLVEDALRVKLQDDGLLREKELALLATRPMVEVVTEDLDEAVVKTVELMKQGTQTIYRPVLMHGHWVARPDILERVQGASSLGEYYYVACDIKRSKRLKDEYCFQGCFYAELLAHVQGVKPVQGYVMHPDGIVESYLLEEYTTKFHLTLDAIERILEGEAEPHFLTSDCKQSPWFHVCKTHTGACDDLSRINRIWRSEVTALTDAGIRTVTDFAHTTKGYLAAHVHGITGDRLAFLQEQARALVEDRVIALGPVDLPPMERALVIDVESDPLRDAHYLIGVLEVEGGATAYRAFLAKKPEDEGTMWREFVSYLAGKPGMPIVHYGWFEVDVIKALAERHGTPDVPGIVLPHMVDVLGKMRERIIFPLSFYSLKDVAKYLGFRWRSSEASGMDSIGWYEDWLNRDDTA
ncbi:TM0106 family RecB-like putative nuclease, partial [Candidatus Uhrbacteria bacterium]|nr:TM0106 family RecB-like putative nuclease [Candidatus Uhrbacteria bacterium]